MTDLERIGDHAENVLGYALQMKEDKRKFSDKALKNLKELSQQFIRFTIWHVSISQIQAKNCTALFMIWKRILIRWLTRCVRPTVSA